MKLYIADKTCSEAVQIIANEIGIEPQLIHVEFDTLTTSEGDNFRDINPLLYIPALMVEEENNEIIKEVIVITNWLADKHPEAGLIPLPGTLARLRYDQLMVFIATEIQQRHVPLMRKLMTDKGIDWMGKKIVAGYQYLENQLSDGRVFLTGNTMTTADAYLWATFWGERSGVDISHLPFIQQWKKRMDLRPSVQKALRDEAFIVEKHRAQRVA